MHNPIIPFSQKDQQWPSPLSPTTLIQKKPLDKNHNHNNNIFNIPELVFRICFFLNRQELFILVQLSKHFNSLCCPILYKHIVISTPFQFHRFISDYTQKALIRYAIHIQALSTPYYTLLNFFLHSNFHCLNLVHLEFFGTLRYKDPDIPRGFYSEDGESTFSRALSSYTIHYGQDEISSFVQRNMETVAATTTRTNVNFNESLLISMIDKCPRLSRFIMAGFPFGHDQLIHQIADRLVSRSQDLSSETALNLIPSPVPDSASNTALTRPTTGGDGGGGGLKKLELTNLHLCELRAKPIQYLLDRCTPDLEELILTISFGSKAEAEYMGQENIATWADNNNSMDEDEDEDNDHFSSATPRSGQSHSVNGKSWKLRKLVLKGDLSGQGPLIWLPLLQKSRQLQILCVDVFQNLTMRQLAHTLGTCCPVVSEITLQCMTAPQQDSDIAELIQSSRSWRSLSMSFFHGFGPLSTLALIKHSYSLETLILEECDGLESRDIQTVLTTCSQLKTFRVMTSNGADFHSTMYLDAEDMMNSPWVCNGLVNLKLMIAGIPRPDLQTDQYGVRLTGPLHDGMMSGYEYHRTVYQQLGRLKNLRELWLGHDKQDLDDEENYYATEVIGQWKFIDPDEQFECLEFSLRSGLDELRGLKELRVLNVDRMNTRIGLSEVQWMVQQWPKLEKIIGLVIQGETRPKCVQWLYDNRPNIELPSVLGNFYTSR